MAHQLSFYLNAYQKLPLTIGSIEPVKFHDWILNLHIYLVFSFFSASFSFHTYFTPKMFFSAIFISSVKTLSLTISFMLQVSKILYHSFKLRYILQHTCIEVQVSFSHIKIYTISRNEQLIKILSKFKEKHLCHQLLVQKKYPILYNVI